MKQLILVVCLVLLLSSSAYSQAIFGSIQGTVTDESGGVVPGVSVTARNPNTGIEFTRATNDLGIYFIGELRPGVYEVRAQMPGFSTFVRSDINVRVEDRLRLDIVMKVGELNQTVEVSGQAPQLQTEGTTVGKVLPEETIKQLPLSGRNAFSLALLTPGTQEMSGDEQVRISGGRARTGEVVLDGSTVTDPRRGETSYTPNLDAVQEFKVQTNGLSAEYGRLVGGIINATLKSGTNQFHGNAFEFHRNDNLNARNFFSDEVPKLVYNQFGGMIGGPIIHDRTFFFFDYEGVRDRSDDIFNLTVPIPAYKSGDFSSLLGKSVGKDALGRTVYQNQIFDPATTTTAPNGKLVREPFPNNTIPASRFDVAGAKIMSLFVDPNRPGLTSNFQILKPSGDTRNKFDVRVDHRFSEKDLFFQRVSVDRLDTETARPFPASASGGEQGRLTRWLIGATSWTRTLSPTTLHDFRFSFFRGRLYRNLSQTDTSDLNIPNIEQFRLPRFTISGFTTLGDGQQVAPTQEQYQFQEILTVLRGRHILKFGADIRRIRVNDLQWVYNGTFTLSRNQTADPTTSGSGHVLASLLLGLMDQYSNDPNNGRFYQRSSYMGLFAQDDFKVSPTLTLNLGLRYDVEQYPNEIRWHGSNFDLVQGKVVTMEELGRNRIQFTDKNNFGPRVGFAWRPFGEEKTVVRSHFGLFYMPLTGLATSAFNRFPYSQTNIIRGVGVQPAVVLSKLPPIVLSQDGKGLGQVWRDPHDPVGYFEQWNLDVQHQLSSDLMVQATYSASVAHHLLSRNDFNMIPIEVVQKNGKGNASMRPYPDYDRILSHQASGNSTYHSLQLSAEKRFSKGLSFLSSFTWSKMIDDCEDNFGNDYPQDPYRKYLEKSLSQAHIPLRLVFSGIYELPFGKGRQFQQTGPLSYVLGGWQMTGILQMQSGQQVRIVQSTNTSQTLGWELRPNLVASPVLPENERTVTRWFNTAAFQAPAPLTYGNASRTPGIEGPGDMRLDFGLHRNFGLPITEATRVEFRAECFNCTNRVNFGLPAASFGTATFGQISSAGTARYFQFGLKVWF
jgi:hypothetical protein